jgi:hypothetical protein
MTAREFRAKSGLGEGKVQRFIREKVASGEMEAFRGTALKGKLLRPEWWYRPKT